jgi:hypothetical protein
VGLGLCAYGVGIHTRGNGVELAERLPGNQIRIASAYRCANCGDIVEDKKAPVSTLHATAGAMQAEQRRMDKRISRGR